MVLKHDGIIMAKDIIEFPEGTGGFDLTDISEKIIDTEIFFDNADDSVVHVEMDGKSYQHGEPTPDYPIEIHSLNDFDVVSSVGKRNLLKGTSDSFKEINPRTRFTPLPENSITPISKYGLKVGDTVTFRVYIQAHNSVPVNVRITPHYMSGGYGSATGNRIQSGKEGYSTVTYTIPSNVDRLEVGLDAPVPAGNTSILMYYKEAKLEKSKTVADWTPAPEDIIEGTNHPLIDKINLSLDEPLRSVGDVKDRLFRDSDGLWKIERNVGEATFDGTEEWRIWYSRDKSAMFGLMARNLEEPMLKTNGLIISNMFPSMIVNSIDEEGIHAGTAPRLRVRVFYERVGTTPESTDDEKINSFKQWLSNIYTEGVPLTIVYEVEVPTIEILDQELQDKLNNLRSFQDSNYVYTVINDKTDILSNYVTDNLKPTLHARFKSEDYGILNNDYGINYPDKITYLGTYFKHGDLVTQEFIESED